MRMINHDLKTQILEYIQKNDVATVTDLSNRFNIAASTCCRYLSILEEDGSIRRFHGGAIPERKESSPEITPVFNSSEKLKLGKFAATLVKDNNSAYIGPGETCYHLYSNLTAKNISVFTNSIPCLSHVNQKIDHLYLIGGEVVNSYSYHTIFGNMFLDQFSRVNPDWFFFSPQSINRNYEIMSSNDSYQTLFRFIKNRSGKKVLLVESNKFEKEGPFFASDLSFVDYLITDKNLPTNIESDLLKMNIKLFKV